MKPNKRHWLIFISALSLLIGFLIYIVFRSETLLMFQWFRELNIYDFILGIRKSITTPIPNWVIFSLPYSLWNFSLGTSLIAIWYKKMNNFIKYSIVALVLLFGVVIELLQGLTLLRGTFDIIDFILLNISAIIVILLIFIDSPKH